MIHNTRNAIFFDNSEITCLLAFGHHLEFLRLRPFWRPGFLLLLCYIQVFVSRNILHVVECVRIALLASRHFLLLLVPEIDNRWCAALKLS